MITEFQGEYRWLSNFTPVQITLDEVEYPSVEHAYQSAKSEEIWWKAYCKNPNNKAGNVKKKCRECITPRDDWDNNKVQIMFECLWQKYNTDPYRAQLIATGDKEIQEGNSWGDTYWGICKRTGEGQNKMGKLLMLIRRGLRNEISINDMVQEVRELY